MQSLFFFALLLSVPTVAVDNGIGLTPPMVRRSVDLNMLTIPLRPGLAPLESVCCTHQPGHYGDNDGGDGEEVPSRWRSHFPEGPRLYLRRA